MYLFIMTNAVQLSFLNGGIRCEGLQMNWCLRMIFYKEECLKISSTRPMVGLDMESNLKEVSSHLSELRTTTLSRRYIMCPFLLVYMEA
jgi:hypothetical protein